MSKHTLDILNTVGLDGLKPFAIKVTKQTTDDGDDLYSLMYDQLNSPSSHPVVMECRGLVVVQENNNWSVVACGFDRFFNYGEKGTDKYKDDKDIVFTPKLDGSLIRIYKYKGKWIIGSKSVAIAGSTLGWRTKQSVSMKDLVFKCLGIDIGDEKDFQIVMNASDYLDGRATYIFELTTPENCIVTQYTDYNLTLLAVRYPDGKYEDIPNGVYFNTIDYIYGFTPEQMVACANNLKNFEEGYVGYKNLVPILKIKNPAHVSAHHLSTNLNPERNVLNIILCGEMDEYTAYFGDKEGLFEKYNRELKSIYAAINDSWSLVNDIEDQKTFALEIKKLPLTSVFFQARKYNKKPLEVLASLDTDKRLSIVYNELKRLKVITR